MSQPPPQHNRDGETPRIHPFFQRWPQMSRSVSRSSDDERRDKTQSVLPALRPPPSTARDAIARAASPDGFVHRSGNAKTPPAKRSIAVVVTSPVNREEFTYFPAAKKDVVASRPRAVKRAGAATASSAASAASTSPRGGSGSSTPATTTGKDGQVVNKRGRPRGWKPGMAYTEIRPRAARAAAAASAAAVPGLPKKRGRPKKPPPLTPAQEYHRLQVPFMTFSCEWEGCRAGLHNLATLRRHVEVVHCRGEKSRGRCLWGSCGSPGGSSNDRARNKLEYGRGLMEHVEEKHLIPFAWHCGDGPRNDMPDEYRHTTTEEGKRKKSVPRWLCDAEGRQVTDGVEDQPVEDWNTWKANRRKLRDLIKRRDENLLSGGEEEEEGEEGEEQDGARDGGAAEVDDEMMG